MSERITMRELGHAGRQANQLWQVAATVGLAHRHGYEVALPADWEYRRFYQVPDEWFADDLTGAINAPDLATHMDRRARPYLQDLSLFADIADEIRAWFRLRPECAEVVEREWSSLDLGGKVCAVHVRRGDTLRNPPGTIQPLSAVWYRKALRRALPYDSLVVFSDDPDWCARHLGNGPTLTHIYRGVPRSVEQDPAYTIEPVLDWIDLAMMAKADRHVISNSSYGWWGAWLSASEKVVYPRHWFGPKIAAYTDYRLMIPPGWCGCS